MFNFIFLSLITITISSSNYTFKTIKSYSYIEYDKNNDTFINYPEKTEEIKIEILDDNTNYTFSSLNIYQYINKEDVRQDNNTNEFINFVYYSTFENNKTIKKKGDYFVITNNSPEKENLSSIINYISFMPNIPNEKIQIDKIYYGYLKNERVNKYVSIEYNKTYNHLFIQSNDNSLIFYIGNSTCIDPIQVCEIVLDISSNSSETRLLNIRNSNLANNSSASYSIIVWVERKNELEINSSHLTKSYFFNNSKIIKFKNPELYNKFNESAFIWVSHSPYSSINITSPMEKLSNIFWKGINNLNFYFYYFKINNNNNSQEISFNFEYNGNVISDFKFIAVPPTVIINYPEQFSYYKAHYDNTQFLRIYFGNSFEKENLILKFSSRTICLNRTYFPSDITRLNYCKTFDLKNAIDNTYLDLLFFYDISDFKTVKNISYDRVEDYNLYKFTLNESINEISFYYPIFDENENDIYITFIEGPKSDKYTYIIIDGEPNYNPNKSCYDNVIKSDKFKENQKVIQFNFKQHYSEITLILIGPKQSETNSDISEYTDYFSIRHGNIIINEDVPYSFDEYGDNCYIVFQFNITKLKNYSIEFSFKNNIYLAEISQKEPNYNENSLPSCENEYYCKFKLNNVSSNVFVTIKKAILDYQGKFHEMNVLLTEDSDFESMNYGFKSKFFNKKFNYKYILPSEKLNFTLNDELGFVLKTNIKNVSLFNIVPSSESIQDENIKPYNNYYFKYIYLSESSSNDLSFNISYEKEDYIEPIEIAFSYMEPSTKIILGQNKNKIETKYIEGIPIYAKLIKEETNNSNITYIIGASEGEYFPGNIIEGIKNNNFSKIKQKYFFSNNYSEITTFRFNFIENPQIAYAEIKGEYELYYERPFKKQINFTFDKNETKYFIGLYSSIQFERNLSVSKHDNITFSIIGKGDINSLYEEETFKDYIILDYSLIDIIKMESKGIGNVILTFTDVINPPPEPEPPEPTPPEPEPPEPTPPGPEPTPIPTPSPSSTGDSNTFAIIIVVVIFAVAIIVGVVILVFIKRNKEPNMSSFVSEEGAEMMTP